MRLLKLGLRNELSIASYDGDKLPPYAILSHTWGNDDEELTYEDVVHDSGKTKAGLAKIIFCGQQARKDDLEHFWVDSCCIKKSSDAELSESLNSMFRWYKGAEKCYVYLQDVSALKRDSNGQPCDWESAFLKSRWFKRGWTLQELIAPKIVEFWTRDGRCVGTKDTLRASICATTGIQGEALDGLPLARFTVNDRRRWAANRETKRKEDKAYCLWGLFDITMPASYGEGEERAFERLNDEIRKRWSSRRDIPGHLDSYNQGGGTPEMFHPGETTQQQAQRREDVLASLDFDQSDSRQSTIKAAERTTCGWILNHPDYMHWSGRDKPPPRQDVMWIVGNAGTGKSTIMKFALARAKRNKIEDETIISFFFNAAGEELEKSVVGMYRSLLFQLLTAIPDLRRILDEVDLTKTATWTCQGLQDLLRTAIETLGRRRLSLFIDALDECDEMEIREMVRFFENIGEDTAGENSRLYICFASRHYPTIKVEHSCRLVLEEQDGHAEDIAKYIRRQLPGNSVLFKEIQDLVRQKANGIFMWVVLVVDILNEGIREGQRGKEIKKRLEKLPSKLSELFKDLIGRDNANKNRLLLCLQWILFARRPLKPEEFYFAMEAGLVDNADAADWQPDPWDKEDVTDVTMKLFVLNSSKGLAELTRSKKEPTVQFIHESVRDFLLKEGGLCELRPELGPELAGPSHDRLKQCCSRYMTADLSELIVPGGTLPKASTQEAKSLRRQVSDSFPFLEYASQQVLYHADEAARRR